jgi:hypothetical protein
MRAYPYYGLLLLACTAPCLAAQEVVLRLRPNRATVSAGQSLSFEVLVARVGYQVRVVSGAVFTTTCGEMDSDGVFHSSVPGTCEVTAIWTTPEGRKLRATAEVRIVEQVVTMPPPEPPPPPPAPAQGIPQFPWPPPLATAWARIPRGLVTKPGL